MAINSSEFWSLIRKYINFSLEFSYNFVDKHPFVSCTLLFFFLFYVLSPSLTWFLMYSLPLLSLFTILLIVFFSIPNFILRDDDSKSSRKTSAGNGNGNDNDGIDNKHKAFIRARSVRRRKTKNYIEESSAEECAPARVQFSDHDFVDKGALIEEKLKDIREVEVHSVSDRARAHAECSSSSSVFKNSGHEFPHCPYEPCGKSFKSFSNVYERRFSEDDDDEDEKNLMDLGLSEAERTKRLESLMARRRARKMLSLQVRRSLMNIGNKENFALISSLVIPRSNSSSQFSPTPGSAPSVLGPIRNPFDLPYDQHEEKPNVRGGSFMQEFMLANEQKDSVFCRHESFSSGASFPRDLNIDQREQTHRSDLPPRQWFPEGSQHFIPRHQIGREGNNRVVEEVPSQASEPEMNVAHIRDQQNKEDHDTSHDEKDGSEVQIKSVLVETTSTRTSSPSSSSEEDEPFYKIDKDAILKSIASPALRNLPSDPSSSLDNARDEERFYYPNRPTHRTNCESIASDLQVEVSEVGSPPGSEISIDGEIEKGMTFSGEDALLSSSQLARVEENESNSREVHEVSEQDIVEFGFSRFQMPENNIRNNSIPTERLVEQDSIPSRSFPPPTRAGGHQQRRPEVLSVVGERFQQQQRPFATNSLPSPTSVLQTNCLIERESSSNFDQLQDDPYIGRSDSIASFESELSLDNPTLRVSELPPEAENSTSAVFSTIGQGHHSVGSSGASSSMSVSRPSFATDHGSSSNFGKNKQLDEISAETCNPNTSQRSEVQSSFPNAAKQKFTEDPKSLTSHNFDDSQSSSSSSSPQDLIQPKFSINDGSSSKEQKRMQDSISLQSTVGEVPTASSSSSSPKSGIQQKSSTSQEQIGESSSPSMSQNTRTLFAESAADQLHHADAKTKPSKDNEEKPGEEATTVSSNKTTTVSSDSTTKQQKSSDDDANSASPSTNKNQHLTNAIGITKENSEKGSVIEGESSEGTKVDVQNEDIKSKSERTDSKDKVKDYP